MRKPGSAAVLSLAMVIVVAGLTGWLGFRADESRLAVQQRDNFLQAARAGALALTTVGDADTEGDIQRILDSSTGRFHAQVQARATDFAGLVKQAQTNSVGTVTDAAIESEGDQQAQVLVVVSVKTAGADSAADQRPTAWRVRITVANVAGVAKVSDVQFVT
jgi:Mce-associated membrane protein